MTEELFARFPKVRTAEAGRFDHLLVDEYQDTNGSQYRIVKALAAGHRNLCVVGDDDQSIYGWRGAEVTHILRFDRDWPEAKVVRLEDNYRSTREIIAWANRLIAFNRKRHAKVLRAGIDGETPRILQLEDEAVEAKHRGRRDRQRGSPEHKLSYSELRHPLPHQRAAPRLRDGTPPGEDALCARRRHVVLRSQGSPRLLAYLKTLANPRDEVSLLRIINTPPRGIGQAAVKNMLEKATTAGRPLWDVLGESGVDSVVGDSAK